MRTVLADPSRTVLKIVTRLLEKGRHEVRPFDDGKKAFDCIRADSEVRALITSAELPSLSGIELCSEVRRLASTQRPIYILLMSSSGDQRHLVRALDNGADDFICKPPAAEELYARLRAADRVTSMQAELIRLAMTDPLTGVCNRRAFFEHAAAACLPAQAGCALAAIIFDIDNFKRINHANGHEAGDAVLRAVAQQAAQAHATVGRLGGEEFAILLEGSLSEAAAAAEDLRRVIAGARFGKLAVHLPVTCSFGVSAWQARDTIDHLLKRADVALYDAKLAGRNRVIAVDAAVLDGRQGRQGVVRAAARRQSH